MTDKTLAELAEHFRGIDIAVLTTITDGDVVTGRPMSNNGDVEYDGTSYYFTYDASRTVADIERRPGVGLSFTGNGFWAVVAGTARLVRDHAAFEAHWAPDLDKWFENGIDTPGLVLIEVAADRIRYWAGEDDEGELVL